MSRVSYKTRNDGWVNKYSGGSEILRNIALYYTVKENYLPLLLIYVRLKKIYWECSREDIIYYYITALID